VDRNRAASVPPTNDADPTPASIPNADVRFPSGTLSAYTHNIKMPLVIICVPCLVLSFHHKLSFFLETAFSKSPKHELNELILV